MNEYISAKHLQMNRLCLAPGIRLTIPVAVGQ